MPDYELYTVLPEGERMHFKLTTEPTLGDAWYMAERIAELTPSPDAVRVYYGGLPVLEVAGGVTQPSIWFREDS